MSNLMKLTAAFVLFFLCSIGAYSQSVIDFEDLNLNEGDEVFDQYSNGPCGVRFYLGDPADNIHPVLAQVGAPLVAFVGPAGTSAPACNSGTTTSDMPHPSAGVGCWFLTDDGILSTASSELRVLYNSPTTQCSGDLIDIDGTEIWTIDAYFQGALIASQSFTTANATPGDGMATPWQFNLSQPLDELRFSVVKPGNLGIGIAFDNFSACSLQEETCCPGRNLITNGDFSQGNTGFFSAYDFQSVIGQHSVLQNEFTITNGSGAGSISDCLRLNDASSCDPSDNFMVINGNTSTQSSQAVWATQVQVTPNTQYQFCASFKNLPNCCFDKEPEVTVLISGQNAISQTISTSSGACDWQTVIQSFNSGSASAISVVILLADAPGWDGNDLAIDEISLKEIPQVAASQVAFSANVTPDPSSPFTHFNVSGMPLFAPGPDCDFFWEVCELDGAGNCIPNTTVINPAAWQTIPTNFPGYVGSSTLSGTNPGRFDYNRTYRIVYGVSCPCESENRSAWIYEPRPMLGSARGYYLGYERDTDGNSRFVPVGEEEEITPSGLLKKMKDLEGQLNLEIVPNPASDYATLSYHMDTPSEVSMQIVDPTGKVVYETPAMERSAGDHQHELQIDQFTNGIYLVRMEIGTRTMVRKLVIQN